MFSTRVRSGHLSLRHLLVTLTALCLLAACGSGGNQGQPPTARSISTNTSQLAIFDLGIPQAALNSPVVGTMPESTSLHVIVTFKPNDPLLNRLGANGKNPSNKGTDVASLANQLGITDQQYQQIKQFFGIQGISLNLSKLHTSMTMDANAGTFASLFHTTFVYHQYRGRKFYAPSSAIMLPQAIIDHIVGIAGLDNYSQTPLSGGSPTMALPLDTKNASDICAQPSGAVSMQQIASAYGFSTLYKQGWHGEGVTILLPEYAATDKTTLQAYLNCVHFQGKITFKDVGTPPTTLDFEPLLDLEMVTALLPKANIVVYEADHANGWLADLDVLTQIESDYSKNQAPVELSYSWSAPEDYVTIKLLEMIDVKFHVLSAEHINLFTDSGDCGAYASAEYPNNLDVSFPSADPYAISVGGTVLATAPNGSRAGEVVWQGNPNNPKDCENHWGSGGGNSIFFSQPVWQQAPGTKNKNSDGHRQLPDVSAVGHNILCLDKNGQGQLMWYRCGGTSASTPIWAASYGLVNQGLSARTGYFISGTPVFYWIAQNQAKQNPFFDVQQGNNLYYSAGSGWDYASGLGTPNLVGIYNGLIGFIQSQSQS